MCRCGGAVAVTVIGGLYVAGFVVHFWWLFLGITVVLIVIALSKPKVRAVPPNTSQARYSNRR